MPLNKETKPNKIEILYHALTFEVIFKIKQAKAN